MKDRMIFTATTETISVLCDGKNHTVPKSAQNFAALRAALLAEDWNTARAHLDVRDHVERWARGRFTFDVDGTALLFDKKMVPTSFNRRVMEMARQNTSPEPLFRFFERLEQNSSWRSKTQVFDFLEHLHLPILPSGHFLAYKGVEQDYMDSHSRTIRNKPGDRPWMPRNEISDDPDVACHVGLHVGDESYARTIGARVVICAVNPRDVVCVPRDKSCRKMRTCCYLVVGNGGATLPSEVYDGELPEWNPDGTNTEPSDRVQEKVGEFGPPPTVEEMMQFSIGELREMAVHDFEIVGAGHIQGGKIAVIEAILAVIRGTKS